MLLTGAHYIYMIFIVVILLTMMLKKDTIVPCILGVFALAIYYTHDIVFSVGAIFNSLIIALSELGPIILIIAAMMALSKVLEDNDTIELIVKPFTKVIKNRTTAFFTVGLAMLILSWFFWPSPSTALVGAVFLPIAMRVGLPAIGVAVSLNLFGHGLALSTDYVIQGAPSITAGAAGIPVQSVIQEGTILYWTMAIVTIGIAYYMLMKDIKNNKLEVQEVEPVSENKKFNIKAKIASVLVAVSFALDIWAMSVFELRGGDATALLGGTAAFLIMVICIMNHGKKSLERVSECITEGFVFGIRIFGPIIPIAAFFYMGESGPLQSLLGSTVTQAPALLGDIGMFLANTVPMNKFMIATVQTIVGFITGLDGSGFSGIALNGSLAQVFGTAVGTNVGALTALGQIAGIWTGGGTLVPWALIPAAAICGVSPYELAKRNLIPVTIGLAVTTLVAIFII